MKKILALLLALILAIAPVGVLAGDEQSDAIEQQQEVVEYSNYMLKNMVRVYAHTLADNYYYGINDNELLFTVICNTIDEGKFDINNAVKAMVEKLNDEHAEFYTPEEYSAMVEDISGEFSGIGVTITENEKGILVLEVIERSPAMRAGIMDGDYIIGVDGASVEGQSVSQVRNLVVGKKGTEVKVTLKRGNDEIEVTCVRDTVQVSNIETGMITDDIAYLRLVQFSQNAPAEVAEYVKQLQQKNVKKLVFDLRDNPGGDIDAAVAIANTFISAGNLGEIRYKNPEYNTFLRSTNYNAPRMKIALLVNENSASASEFLAMAFQGRAAGKIIGTQTYGKGSMQALSKIATGAGLKYTIGEFFTIKGKRVHTVGITPDIFVANEYVPVKEENFAPIDLEKVEETTKGGENTLAVEQRLEVLGLFEEEPDSVYDEKTSEAILRLQTVVGYDPTGVPGFYELLYLNDYSYKFDIEIDKQLDAAIDYLK